jgi:hypothetical protein
MLEQFNIKTGQTLEHFNRSDILEQPNIITGQTCYNSLTGKIRTI